MAKSLYRMFCLMNIVSDILIFNVNHLKTKFFLAFFDKIKIYLAMYDLEKYTCIKLKSRESQEDYIYVESGRGCSSNLGRIGGRQSVSLRKDGCLSRGSLQLLSIYQLILT